MKRFILFSIIILFTTALNAQIKIGPVVNLGLGFYNNNSDSIQISNTGNPSFGFALEKYIDYWFSLRGTALYSFKNFTAKNTFDRTTDHLKGQFAELSFEGIFADFNGSHKISPYGSTGLGVGINIVNKGGKTFLADSKYESVLPYFTIGAGIRYKLGFLSDLDLSLNYNRCLIQPINNIDARLNQVNFKIITLF